MPKVIAAQEVWNSPFRDRLFDSADPYKSNLRLIDFKRGTGSSPHVWTMNDVEELMASEQLFARKFDPDVDQRVIDLMNPVEYYVQTIIPG